MTVPRPKNNPKLSTKIPSYLQQPEDKLAKQLSDLKEDEDFFYAGMALKNKSYEPLPVTRSLAEEEKALRLLKQQ